MTDLEPLAQLIAAERTRQGLSLRQLCDRAGGLLSPTTVSALERGKRANYSDETLDGLAKGLGLAPEKVRRAAGVRTGDTAEPFVVPRRLSRLTRKERDLLIALGDALLAARR